MTRSIPRAVVSILLLLIVCGVAGYQLKSSFWPDNTSDASINGLQSYWPSTRRTAASSLSQYAAEADKVVPALVKAGPFTRWMEVPRSHCAVSAPMKP